MLKSLLSPSCRPAPLTWCFCKSIHRSPSLAQNSKQAKQEANFMLKIMTGSKNPKRKTLKNFSMEVQKNLIVAASTRNLPLATTPSGKVNKRRGATLNALFARHIADHMSTSEMTGFDIQITNVKVNPDLSIVKAYWISRTSLLGHSDSLQAELDKYAAKLRRDLSDMRIIGVIPPVKFVPDKELAQGAVVDQLLKTAEMSDEIPEEAEVNEYPPMRHDVYGLDRDMILQKLHRGKTSVANIPSPQEFENIDLEEVRLHVSEFKQKIKELQKQKLKDGKFKKNKMRDDFREKVYLGSRYDEDLDASYEDGDFLDEEDRK